jgi:transposase InsO family protein
MSHAKAKLTPLGRRLLVERILTEGWPAAAAAESMGVSAQTAYKWLRRFRQGGLAALEDRSSRPHRSPRMSSERLIAQVRQLRLARRLGPHRIAYALGVARSTVYGILARLGLNRLDAIDRVSRKVVRYQRERPGELVHVDVKRFARLPRGGGWRALGREATVAHRHKKERAGYDYLHVALDDRSRVVYLEVHPDETGRTCTAFVDRATGYFAELGAPVAELMTDNAFAYTKTRRLSDLLGARGIRHLRIQPNHPETNGKVERFNRTLIEEWAYLRLYRSNAERLSTLPGWLDAYNRRRPHTALGGLSPMDALLNNVSGNYT